MSKKICSNCRFAIQDTLEMFCMFRKLHTEDGLFENCHCFLPKSVFDRITASPEVLAPKFVYNRVYMEYGGDLSYWVSSYFSTIIPGKSWEYEAEAIAATVAKLKEVCDE